MTIPEAHKITLPDITIIGISGRAGSGKDTIASRIQQTISDVYIHPFALFLKDACVSAFGIDVYNFNDRTLKEIPDPYWKVSPRKIAQFVATELFREKIQELIPDLQKDFWIRRLVGFINGEIAHTEGWAPYDEGDIIVIPDVRFENEAEFVRAHGHLIHVRRDELTVIDGLPGHASELGVQDRPSEDWTIINNGTIEELYLEVDKFLDAKKFRFTANQF